MLPSEHPAQEGWRPLLAMAVGPMLVGVVSDATALQPPSKLSATLALEPPLSPIASIETVSPKALRSLPAIVQAAAHRRRGLPDLHYLEYVSSILNARFVSWRLAGFV